MNRINIYIPTMCWVKSLLSDYYPILIRIRNYNPIMNQLGVYYPIMIRISIYPSILGYAVTLQSCSYLIKTFSLRMLSFRVRT